MADALASGASVLRDVGVQVPLRPQSAVPRTGGVEVTSWIQRQHDNRLEAEYVSGLAAAFRWSFGIASEEAKG